MDEWDILPLEKTASLEQVVAKINELIEEANNAKSANNSVAIAVGDIYMKIFPEKHVY